MSAESGAEYVALVRNYHPKGYAEGWWAGCVKRDGGKRMTAICQHRHTTRDEAQTCADRLAAQRNGARLPPDFAFCDVRWHTPGATEEHACANNDPGHPVHSCCCGSVP